MPKETNAGRLDEAEGVRRFTVALSFPGERRDFVESVARRIADTLGKGRVLYDKFHEAEFARADLDVYLPALYRTQSALIVVFLCPEYVDKRWCGLECRHIRQLIGTKDSDRIMFLSFGNPGDVTPLGILPGDGYLDVGARSPDHVANEILKRLRLNRAAAPAGDAEPRNGLTLVTYPPDTAAWVEQLAANLGKRGHAVLLDGGDRHEVPVADLARIWHAIIVVTPEALHSSWVLGEYDRLSRKERAGREPLRITPVSLGEIGTAPVASSSCIDFSTPDAYAASFERLCAELGPPRASSPPSPDGTDAIVSKALARSPLNQNDFLVDVFQRLSKDDVILLAQDDRLHGSRVVDTMLKMAGEKYEPGRVLYLVPLFSPSPKSADYWAALGEQCEFPAPTRNSGAFERELRKRVDRDSPWLLIVNGIENSAEAPAYELAQVMRALYASRDRPVHMVFLGGHRLVNMNYAGNPLSPLAFALPIEWPEIGAADVVNLNESLFPQTTIPSDVVSSALSVSGGHPRLALICIETWHRTGSSDARELGAALRAHPYLRRLVSPVVATEARRRVVREFLAKADLGPAEINIGNDLLAELYWRNLIKRRQDASVSRFVWRCDVIREVGAALLGLPGV